MYGISHSAYAHALVIELQRTGIDARLTNNFDQDRDRTQLRIEEGSTELVVHDGYGDLPWSKLHSENDFQIIIEVGDEQHSLGTVIPTEEGLDSVVQRIKHILR